MVSKTRLNCRNKGVANRFDFPQWGCLCFCGNGWYKSSWSSGTIKPLGAVSYEIPTGRLEAGKYRPYAQQLCVVKEEAAYAGKLELLYDFYSAIGFCNEKLNISGKHLTKWKIHVRRMETETEVAEVN